MIKLRPHHGLCIRHFEGKGYSEEFVKNMTLLIASLTDETEVSLVIKKDDICKACPNWNNHQCDSQERVVRFDHQVLQYIGCRDGEMMTYGDFQALIEKHIINQDRFDLVCGDCEWGTICHKK